MKKSKEHLETNWTCVYSVKILFKLSLLHLAYKSRLYFGGFAKIVIT